MKACVNLLLPNPSPCSGHYVASPLQPTPRRRRGASCNAHPLALSPVLGPGWAKPLRGFRLGFGPARYLSFYVLRPLLHLPELSNHRLNGCAKNLRRESHIGMYQRIGIPNKAPLLLPLPAPCISHLFPPHLLGQKMEEGLHRER
ncbi:hypothetical protein DPX16_16713 [Anabarilius grahami]|uniref:Uncharacterized protein n=1 Tax=Anabarilius grahami TaxID=495550 RepID=A0A3N0YTS7_ANAGA|nr:hypothetical protein DPX16_16713 [Anabarilius grahami]